MKKILSIQRCIALTAVIFLSVYGQYAKAQASGNPILPGYNADPDIQYFNGKYYIYPTGGIKFKAWSSTDLTNWVNEGVIFDLEKQCSWAKIDGWAPHVVFRDGKYYYYYAADAKIGVAVGSTPTGPFTDLGHALIATDPYIEDIIDPAVFIDDDGQAYLYYGGSAQSKMVIRKLAEDMTSFIGGPTLATPAHYTEAPHMLKKGNTYFLTYSNGSWFNGTYNVRYATASSPMGPWNYKGVILSSTGAFTGPGHSSIMKRPGCDKDDQDEYVIVYHRYENGNYKVRKTALDRVYFTKDSIQTIYPTWAGVIAHTGCNVPNPVANGTYRIISKITSAGKPLVLNINKCDTSRSAGVNVSTPSNCPGQGWQLIYADGFYRIVSQQPTHYVLDLANCGVMQGTPLALWDNNGNPCQQYSIEPVAGGYFRIVSRVSGYVLDIGKGGTGANVTHGAWKGLDSQLWKFER